MKKQVKFNRQGFTYVQDICMRFEGHVNFLLKYKKQIRDQVCSDFKKESASCGYLWKIIPCTIELLICQVIIVDITYIPQACL